MNVCLSFDDGRIDSYSNAYKVLLLNNLKASFHVTTGFIDQTFITDSFGVNRAPLTVDNIVEMTNHDMEISSHSDRHIMDVDDFKVSIDKLRKWGIKKDKIGFSIPNSKCSKEELNAFIENNKKDLLYVRVGRNPKCYSFCGKVNYSLYKVFKFNCFYNRFNKFNLLKEIDNNSIYSVVVKKHIKASSIIKFINKYKNTNYSLVLMFHSIVDNPNDKWEWSKNKFDKLCSYLANEKSINVLTLEELVKNGSDK